MTNTQGTQTEPVIAPHGVIHGLIDGTPGGPASTLDAGPNEPCKVRFFSHQPQTCVFSSFDGFCEWVFQLFVKK